MLRREELKRAVQERYGEAARSVRTGSSGCCQPGGAESALDAWARGTYDPQELSQLPQSAVAASLGCANPVALAQPAPGEVVLDLGSGGGIDVLLTARRVGPAGKVYGLDMTDEMLELARENQRKAGVENVEFLKGDIEHIPLPDNHVDLIISNCVINLASDKARVFKEAFRVLKPGGRLAVADMVYTGSGRRPPVDPDRGLDSWSACVAGALHRDEYDAELRRAGFENVEIEIAYEVPQDSGCEPAPGAGNMRLASALIRARRP
ncbi:MAG: arsenite methyltransferase [Firmicutes bacterium]|nr:arsenite methyltransferase [Bacillota bacterium]